MNANYLHVSSHNMCIPLCTLTPIPRETPVTRYEGILGGGGSVYDVDQYVIGSDRQDVSVFGNSCLTRQRKSYLYTENDDYL